MNFIYDENLSKAYSSPDQKGFSLREKLIYSTWLGLMGNLEGKSVLDLGCGNGRSSRLLLAAGAEKVVGVETSPFMLKEAQELEKNLTAKPLYHLAKVEELPAELKQGQFDLVVGAMILHYAQSQSILEQMINNIGRAIKKGGKIFFINLNPSHPVRVYDSFFNSVAFWKNPSYQFTEGAEIEIGLFKNGVQTGSFSNFYYSKKLFAKLLKMNGFSDIRWEKARFPQAQEITSQQRKELEEKMILANLLAKKN